MRAYELTAFGLENLRLREAPAPQPGPGQILLEVHAVSLNYRDLLVVQGQYNPRLELPAIPLSDGAGIITAVGPGVHGVHPGDRATSHFVADWRDGPFQQEYVRSTLGTPGPGLAAEQVVLPVGAIVPLPAGYTYVQAATLPIAALTAWSALVTVGHVQPDQTVLTLGTGGVSIFALQLARSLGARVIVTSSSDEKLARARQLGAQHTINYRAEPDWEKAVLELTGGIGVDLTVETVGPGTLDRSLKATRAGGTVALLGALTGRQGPVTTGLIMMKRIHVAGIMVDSRTAFEALNRHLVAQQIKPVIDREFLFEDLPAAFQNMQAGTHFGKLVVRVKD